MHFGAIITVPESLPLTANFDTGRYATPIASWEVLGESVLERMVERLRISGVTEISVLSESVASAQVNSGIRFVNCGQEWNSTVARYLGYGLETLLLLRIGSYVELDVADLLRFHREVSNSATEVHDKDGALDLCCIDAAHLRDQIELGHGDLAAPARYTFAGYSNRLWDVQDFRRLVKDALMGRAGIRPIGREIAPNIWVDEDAWVDESATILGPTYIGKDSRVHASCTISGASSIEQQCEIDCCTVVDDCCILPHTYLGMALKVRNAVASEHTLFHLGRNIQVQLHDRRLMGVSREPGLFEQARSFLSATVPAAIGPFGQPTNLNWHL